MKKSSIKAVVATMLLSMLGSLFSGCFFKNSIVDGPGMVNYPGVLLEVLLGDWQETGDGGYRIKFWEDMTLSLSKNDELLLVNAQLTLYTSSMLTDEYSEFDVKPNEFTDQAGKTITVTKGSHENGTVTLEFTAADGAISIITFLRVPEIPDDLQPLDGPGMVYYGGYLDSALTGCWHSADGRYILDFDGRRADFTADGVQLVSKDYGYFVDHSFSADDDLNERCELFPTGNYLDDFDEPPLTISEMWYQAERIYMNVIWPDGKADEIVFCKLDETMPEGK